MWWGHISHSPPEAIHCAVKKHTIVYAASDGNMIVYLTLDNK